MSESAPEPRKIRATADTNLFISALIRRGAPYNLVRAWVRGDFILVLSASMVAEISDVARRPYIRDRYHLTEARIRPTERRIERDAEVVRDLPRLPAGVTVRDKEDEHVLRTAIGGGADYLVTGDDDLLALDGLPALGRLRIVRVTDLLAVLSGQ